MYLKDYRTMKHITQKELAKSLGVAQSSITDWETGRANPSIEKLLKISQILDVSIDQLLKGELSSLPGESRNNDIFVIEDGYEKELIKNYRNLSYTKKIKLLTTSQELFQEEVFENKNKGGQLVYFKNFVNKR